MYIQKIYVHILILITKDFYSYNFNILTPIVAK